MKYCELCSNGTSRMDKAKYNAHGQAKYTHDGRFTCTRNKCSALVQYIQVLYMNITKTKHNNVIYYCICLSICDYRLKIGSTHSFFKAQNDSIMIICSG